ncbi:Acyl-CoA dehydrogenase [Saccharopolyspora antimicrobica]|uniref:Acyl-CoA dehydrogenase n=1 Tax=Saccharopolyspora antimicrobica TaxID=455193 RepID=A0A1I4W4W0_9PSEU|nr:acyl-CoA dehydrogenase family protein [Saccharopolyspora antimicrobica]RKT87051.1 alkylation response protein AidB-like acyl-CoA dehydrogenase [Saccharopolyspora antimicrobica]SFN08754.1 Acyl-CoA dehydrogenase [Saccharopolyspora antimicrobica]
MNFADLDPALRPLLTRHVGSMDRVEPVLSDVGAVAAGRLDELAAVAEANPPRLRQYDAAGERVDEVVYHPAYAEMSRLAFERFGFAAMSHRAGVHDWPTEVPHVVKYGLSYVFVQAEFGLFCPVSMTDSAARVLRRFGDRSLFEREIDGLSSPHFDSLLTGAMFMTEKQGGSDVGRTATEATPAGEHWTLRGQKWFASNVSADVILTLARVPGGPEGTKGLGMFMVPRLRPDGSRNTYRIDRLKDKLGSRSMASGEVTLEDCYALPVGDLSRGFLQMAEMVNVSRLSNAMRAVALMRRALTESVAHTRGRVAFGKPLFDQPLMRKTLLPMLLHAEAGLGFVLEAAATLDQADAGNAGARSLIRVLTPLGKYHLCKLARVVTGEAMEIRGGNGYIEDWINPRLLRDAHLGSIWEGSSNVIALDVLRCIRKDRAHELLADTAQQRLESITDPDVAAGAEHLKSEVDKVRALGESLLAADDDHAQALCGEFTDLAAQTTMAALLFEQADHEARTGLGYRKLLVANTYLHHVLRSSDPVPAALRWLDELVDGGAVPAQV